MPDHADILRRLEAGECSNELDIAVEMALFDPPVSVRPNSAGTKLIYTLRSGTQETCWAGDHSMPVHRERTIALIRALEAGK
jgi:hypothetical protein